MKKILILTATVLLAACGNPSEKKEEKAIEQPKASGITLKGSDTVLPLAQKESELYMKSHPEMSITVVGGGSGVGITALEEGSTDIAMSSRPLKMDETMLFKSKNISLSQVIIASDALAVIVNPKNTVSKLTREQIEAIFTGKVTNWKEVGGADAKIIAYSRETSSGTYEFFKEHVMDKKNYATSVLNMPATGAIVQSVSQTDGAIGYVGLAYETKEVKQLAVSYDGGKNYYEPSVSGAQDGTYPISRPLYFVYNSTNTAVTPFVDYVLSEEGQKTVLEVGYVPLKK